MFCSGMVQFKDVFLEAGQRPMCARRSRDQATACAPAASFNDLENVGCRPPTYFFFEVLERLVGTATTSSARASGWGWGTDRGLQAAARAPAGLRLRGKTARAYDIWTEGSRAAAERVIRIGDNRQALQGDNFWMMADTGLRPMLGDLLTTADPGGPRATPTGRRPLHRDLEPRVRPVRRETARHAATHAAVDTSMEPGAPSRHPAARAQQLRDRPVRRAHQGRRAETRTADLANPSLKVIADPSAPPPPSWWPMASSPATRGAATCSGASCARRSATASKLGCKTPFFHKAGRGSRAADGRAYPKLREQQNFITGCCAVESAIETWPTAWGLDGALAGM